MPDVWSVYLAVDDAKATVDAAAANGAAVIVGAIDVMELGTMVGLHTRDYDATVAFYRTVFHWDTHVVSDAPEFRSTWLRMLTLRDARAAEPHFDHGVRCGVEHDQVGASTAAQLAAHRVTE